MKFLLDTDHITILQRQSGREFLSLASRMGTFASSDFGISIVSLHEQIIGCHQYINQSRRRPDLVRGYEMLSRVLKSYSIAPIVSFDFEASSKFDEFAAHRLRVATMDLRIAAIAVANGLTLLTRNMRDFAKVPGLLTEDWTA